MRRVWLTLLCAVLLSGVSLAQTTYALAWNFYVNATATDMVSLYLYEALINKVPQTLKPTCVTECNAPLAITAPDGTSLTLSFRVACVSAPTAFGTATTPVTFVVGGPVPVIPNDPMPPPPNPCAAASPVPPAPPTTLGPCMYAAPATPTVFEQRPIGQHMQGYNAVGPAGVVNNQADRIRVLKTWGWGVVLAQFVPGTPDRLYLVVECRGL